MNLKLTVDSISRNQIIVFLETLVVIQFLETSMRTTPEAGLGRTLGPRQAAPTCLSMVMVMVMVQAVVM